MSHEFGADAQSTFESQDNPSILDRPESAWTKSKQEQFVDPNAQSPIGNEPQDLLEAALQDKADAGKTTDLFSDFSLSREVLLAVQETGYVHPTAVQKKIIPLILNGSDVLAQSQTGTGKTAAFALPLLSGITGKPAKPKILVLAPTRELAMQVADSFAVYGGHMPNLRVLAIYGGADYEPQLRALRRGVHVVVGTPGRVMDHLKRGTLQLDDLTTVVLDEADEMLNLGFIEDVEWILQQTPANKQTALFSATMPEPIRRIADQYLSNPETITIRKKTLTADTIEQRCIFVQEKNKRELLARVLEMEETDGVIVFTKTKDSTITVADHLMTLGLKAAALNGDLPQARRQKTVDQLKAGRLDILVATDVAARGLDVQRISHVVNFDLPHDADSYVHRIGRTGRAGRAGIAYIFLTPQQRGKLRLIEKATKQSILILDPPSKEELNAARIREFKQKITGVAEYPELSLYKKIIADHIAESGSSLEEVAAVLAHLSRDGRPLLVHDLPPLYEDRRESSKRSRERNGDPASGRRGSSQPRGGMARYWVGVGHADGVRPKNLVGAIANEVGIPGSDIGPINISNNFSTVDLPKHLPQDVLQMLHRTWVAGKQLRIRPFREDHSASADRSDAMRGNPRNSKFAQKSGYRKSFPKNGKPTGFKAASKARSTAGPVGGKPKSKKQRSRT
ncbi:MAG: DEAD/DEAH box helicase [bacterium]|nr:DEAD/DEAH box helicase [bacterium]